MVTWKQETLLGDDQPEWLRDLHPNDPPPGLTEVSEAHVVANTKLGVFHPTYEHYRQVFLTDEDRTARRVTPIHMMIFQDDHGVAFVTDWVAARKILKDEETNGPPIRWFTFTGPCEHKYTSERLSNAYYGYTCKKCGYYYEVDSSG